MHEVLYCESLGIAFTVVNRTANCTEPLRITNRLKLRYDPMFWRDLFLWRESNPLARTNITCSIR